ncbi:hypothetical protein [Cohnella abietis]|uniref:Uncharacterized protein n=1 Tax=Cohnella abietis TaxID=2507935 RepID=A0A3T1D9H6_9BACL|nr:hypothetical protein [Cohnella abietis]BBI34740.1 hypothetical protein KCTCHS21_41390 [Cohnella abietis]
MSENKKRSYTIPVLYIIITVLSTFVILSYSKYLLAQQTHTTDQGQRLSEQYNYASLFAKRLHDGAEGLLNAKSESDRLHAVRQLGEAAMASGETVELLIEAAYLTPGQSKKKEEAGKPVVEAMKVIIGENGPMSNIGEHEGPLTGDEIAALTLIRDGVAQMDETLKRFRPILGEAGYRQMITMGEWVAVVNEASQGLQQLAAKL